MAIGPAAAGRFRPSPLGLLALLAGVVALLPLGGVVAAALAGPGADIAMRDILRYAGTSAALAAGVGVTTAIIGGLAAWLVALHQFPGRRLFAWALALPLAMPAFALAYAYADMWDVAGDLRIWMRGHMGFDLPLKMRSLPGAIFVLSCAFYPYVYLAMKAAFLNPSVNMTEAARTLGHGPGAVFRRVTLPLVRPALAAGVALAIMETLADYGAVQFLSVQTLTTGVIRAWSVYGSMAGAAQIALPLLGAAALLLWIERTSRRGRAHEAAGARWRTPAVVRLGGWRGWLATVFCGLLLTLALVAPIVWLVLGALETTPEWPRLIRAGAHSLGLGVAGAAVTVGLAAALALGGRDHPLASRFASLGYATPGAVMAIGLLAPAGIVWSLLPGSGAAIALMLLIYAYAARLMAAALEPIDAGLSRVTPAMRRAARTLGRTQAGAAWSVEVPMIRGALLTALLIVFIDILKELPATLILRPFNFDTLAVLASNYALDERLGQAGPPSLLIILISVPATVWLTRRVARSGPGLS